MLDPQTHNNLILIGVAVMAVLTRLAWKMPCGCEKCAFHVNERRMSTLRKTQARVAAAKEQGSLRHDYEHKGGGFRTGDPDRFNCADDACPRNPRPVETEDET